MAYILAGGGDPPDSIQVDAWYRRALLTASEPKSSHVALLAQAIAPDDWSFEDATSWVRDRDALRDLDVTTVVQLGDEAALLQSRSVFLMGGNTFRLLHRLRQAGALSILRKIASNGLIYGCSAGAIIAGHSIASATIGMEADENAVGLQDLGGLDLASGYDVLTHFTPDDRRAATALSQKEGRGIICIPENSGGLLHNDILECLGPSPISIICSDAIFQLEEGNQVRLVAA